MDVTTSGGSGLDLLTALNSTLKDGNNGWMDGGNGFLLLFLILLLGANGGWGNGWGGNGNNGAGRQVNDLINQDMMDGAIAKAQAAGVTNDLIMQGIAGNNAAIQSLATATGTNFATVQAALSGLDKGIALAAAQEATSTGNILNAIQAGNSDILATVSSCCCDVKTQVLNGITNLGRDILSQGYESRIATLNQTQTLTTAMDNGLAAVTAKIDAQTIAMNQGFQGIKDYFAAEKIASLQAQVNQLQTAENNANQTNAINGYVNSQLAPIQAQLNSLNARVAPQPVPAYPAPGYNNSGCNCGNNGFFFSN